MTVNRKVLYATVASIVVILLSVYGTKVSLENYDAKVQGLLDVAYADVGKEQPVLLSLSDRVALLQYYLSPEDYFIVRHQYEHIQAKDVSFLFIFPIAGGIVTMIYFPLSRFFGAVEI
jgi:hypothetical protein